MSKFAISIYRKLFAALFAAGLVSTAFAHPGHGLSEHGPAHLMTSPYHMAVLLTFGLVMLAVGQFSRRASAQRSLRIAGTAAIAMSAVLWALQH